MAARPGTLDLPHRAYIEALADEPEGSESWHAIVAGYAALQLFESWMEGGLGATAPGRHDLWRVRHYVEAVPERHSDRRALVHLVDSIERATVDLHAGPRGIESVEVGRVLATYAGLLHFDAKWRLATDVHETVVEFARRTNDVQQLLDALLMIGFALRMQARFDEASATYAALRRSAIDAKNVRYELESHLSDAKVAIDRGNLPFAGELLDRTVAEARRVGCWRIVAKGLGDRARIALAHADHDLALECLYEAFELTPDDPGRDRILTNIGLTLARMGLRDAARDAALLVAGTAQDTITRLTALVNLMELAHQDGRELVFEQYRRDLAGEFLTPYLEVVYLETCIEGFRTFGRHTEARHAAARMLEVAERHHLNEYVLKAEALARDAAVAPHSPIANDRPPSSRSIRIARVIAEMRVDGLPG